MFYFARLSANFTKSKAEFWVQNFVARIFARSCKIKNVQVPLRYCMGKTVTLGRLLYYSIGEQVSVELKDETAVEGTLTFCDVRSLNIELENAVVYRRRGKNLQPLSVLSFFARGRHIRFVHFSDSDKVRRTLSSALRGQ